MADQSTVFFADFSFNTISKELRQKNTIVPLQPKQADLLTMLLTSPNVPLTRQQIQEKLWPNQVLEFDQSINFCIKCVRQALNDNSKQPTFIQTVPRRGYRFIAPLHTKDKAQIPSHQKQVKNKPDNIYGRVFIAFAFISAVIIGGAITGKRYH